MSTFEFTPGGVRQLGESTESIAPKAITETVKDRAVVQALPASKEKTVNVIQLAKARLKEIEREIKRLKTLESERDELRRLLDAANNKPRAIVREIKAAHRG